MPSYSLGDVLRTTAKTSKATAAWKSYHDDQERRPLENHSQCYEENCGFPVKDTKAVNGTPVAQDKGDSSIVVVATRRWQGVLGWLILSFLTTTLVLSAITLGRVSDDGGSSAKDCADEVIAWRHVEVVGGAPPSDAVLILMDDGTYLAHDDYDGSGVGHTRPCLHLMHAELTKRGQTWSVDTRRRLGVSDDRRRTHYVLVKDKKYDLEKDNKEERVIGRITEQCLKEHYPTSMLTKMCNGCDVCETCETCSFTCQDCFNYDLQKYGSS